MKKTARLLAVMGIVCMLQAGCSNTPTNSTPSEGDGDKPTSSDVAKETPTPPKEEKQYIELGVAIEEKDWTITLENISFTQDLNPSTPSSFYTHYQVKDTDNTYLVATLTAKNIAEIALRADKVAKMTAKYNDKYEYTSFDTMEKSDGSNFDYTNITDIKPLTTGKLHYLAEMPKTIADESDTALEIKFEINNKQYYYKVR